MPKAKYDPEVTGPGRIMLDSERSTTIAGAQAYAQSILNAVSEAVFIERNGMSVDEHTLRQILHDWTTPIQEIATGESLAQMLAARAKFQFAERRTEPTEEYPEGVEAKHGNAPGHVGYMPNGE